jgi:hypothetical protein
VHLRGVGADLYVGYGGEGGGQAAAHGGGELAGEVLPGLLSLLAGLRCAFGESSAEGFLDGVLDRLGQLLGLPMQGGFDAVEGRNDLQVNTRCLRCTPPRLPPFPSDRGQEGGVSRLPRGGRLLYGLVR